MKQEKDMVVTKKEQYKNDDESERHYWGYNVACPWCGNASTHCFDCIIYQVADNKSFCRSCDMPVKIITPWWDKMKLYTNTIL